MQTLRDALADYQRNAKFRAERPEPAGRTDGIGDPGCTICHGLGYVRFDLPVGHPQFGQIYLCDCTAAEQHAQAAERLNARSGLEPEDAAIGWNNLLSMPGIGESVAVVQQYMLRGWGWVYLHGAPGPGKTLILRTAVSEYLRREHSAALVTWADLLSHLRAGVRDDSYDERLQHWRTVRLLAIDEMGRAKETEWTDEVETRLLNFRYEQGVVYRRGLTLFASNLPETDYDNWLTSRLLDGRNRVIHIDSPDLRPAMEE